MELHITPADALALLRYPPNGYTENAIELIQIALFKNFSRLEDQEQLKILEYIELHDLEADFLKYYDGAILSVEVYKTALELIATTCPLHLLQEFCLSTSLVGTDHPNIALIAAYLVEYLQVNAPLESYQVEITSNLARIIGTLSM